MEENSPKYYTPKKAHELGMFTGLSLRTVRDKCRQGKIPCKNVGSNKRPIYLISEDAIAKMK